LALNLAENEGAVFIQLAVPIPAAPTRFNAAGLPPQSHQIDDQ